MRAKRKYALILLINWDGGGDRKHSGIFFSKSYLGLTTFYLLFFGIISRKVNKTTQEGKCKNYSFPKKYLTNTPEFLKYIFFFELKRLSLYIVIKRLEKIELDYR